MAANTPATPGTPAPVPPTILAIGGADPRTPAAFAQGFDPRKAVYSPGTPADPATGTPAIPPSLTIAGSGGSNPSLTLYSGTPDASGVRPILTYRDRQGRVRQGRASVTVTLPVGTPDPTPAILAHASKHRAGAILALPTLTLRTDAASLATMRAEGLATLASF